MKNVKVYVGFALNGEHVNVDDYNIEIPVDTKEDDEMEAIMDAICEVLNEEFDGDEDWENGDYEWTVRDYDFI